MVGNINYGDAGMGSNMLSVVATEYLTLRPV